jgi:hypothetical protein
VSRLIEPAFRGTAENVQLRQARLCKDRMIAEEDERHHGAYNPTDPRIDSHETRPDCDF